VSFTLIFLDSALPSGISTTMTISGTYTGGSFTATRRVVLP
jgi:hypothetical protein